MWKRIQVQKRLPQLHRPILIEGLPGIGNVGKVAVDFLIEQLDAKLMYRLHSNSFPHSVFVNDENLVEMPTMEIYYRQRKNKPDLLFLAGDIQPIDERSTYEFCAFLLDFCKELEVQEIITIGGIGLPQAPEKPKIYCAGNRKEIMQRYRKGTRLQEKLHGIVGPIIGVTGLLTGLAGERNIPAICLLAETQGHPLYLGVKGSQEILKVLEKNLGLKLNLRALDREIAEVEAELIENQHPVSRPPLGPRETSYIG
ncbi:MAG TPA: PAC2 family protein [Candidatus Nanoarchaeia archaeon]|nr:PAC2 family protein [Candidatus Nanoarchaeia archaeon]